MSVEIPYDLIKQVHTAVLKEANFSSYDPDDASYPELQSLESSISELDPSPPYLRCNHCKGRFLRGVRSLICVFCGKQQAPQDAPPEPINFNNTFGCRWLLESLGLDGSEIAGFPVNGNESNRGQSATQEEFPLSNLLDLEIQWNPEFDKLGTDSNESSMNINGANPDNFLAERNGDDSCAVTVEQSLPIKNDNGYGNNDFQVRDNLSFFENVQSSDTVVWSVEDKSGSNSFSGWDANFQSAAAGTSHEESKSFDPVAGCSVDLSVHMDAVFGSGNSLAKDKEDIVSSRSKTNDCFQDVLSSNSNSGIFGHSKQVEVAANEENARTVQNANTSSSMSIDWIRDGQWQSDSYKAPDNKTTDEEDNSFATWNDFTSSTTAERSSVKQIDQAKQFEETTILKDDGKVESPNNSSSRNIDWVQDDQLQTISNETPDNKAIDEEDNAFDVWNDFASLTSAQHGQNQQFEVTAKDGRTVENANSSSSSIDWFQDAQQETNSSKAPDNKTINVDDDFFDTWNDFTSSTSRQDLPGKQTGQANLFEITTTDKDTGTVETANKLKSIAWIQDDQWPTISNSIPDNKDTDEGNNLFDTWNDFTRSDTAGDSTSKETGQAKQFEVNTNVKNHGIMEVNNSSFDLFQGDQWEASSSKTPDNKTVNEDYDSFDAWNDFTSSTSVQDPSSKQSVNHNHMTPSAERTSEIKLLATNNNLQNIDFGSFSQPHIFSGALSDQNGFTKVKIMESESAVSNRIPDMNTEDGVNAGEASKGGDVSSATTRTTSNDVGIIMSQIHDLSFMLASDLSIPPK